MQTAIKEKKHPDAALAERILRTCVHCGFCNATCPTYQLEGMELEGPRGRVYLIKGLLEGNVGYSKRVVGHLDHCLSCLSCQTTCPSGVEYSHLIDSARINLEANYKRPFQERMKRKMLARLLPDPKLFRIMLRLGWLARPLAPVMPGQLGAMLRMIPRSLPRASKIANKPFHQAKGKRRMRVALLTGCAQQVLGPRINDATIRLLTRLGCEVVIPKEQGCCGALVYHMGNTADSLPRMKQNIDAWMWEVRSGGLDAVVINTSGCGAVIKDYGHIFRDDPEYRDKAADVSKLAKDVTEVVAELGLAKKKVFAGEGMRVAYHDACSMQHGQQLRAQPRDLLKEAGFDVVEVPEGHLCCGSAGTYNMLQPENAQQLGQRKARSIESMEPRLVAAGNIGCMEQIESYSELPVVHTVELLDWATGGAKPRRKF